MASKRQQKFSRMIQKELAGIFQQHGSSWFSNNIVSVTKVDMSPDLSVAKIHLSFLMSVNREKAFENINHHKNEIRKHLGNHIAKAVRKIPELVFNLDLGAEYADKMENLFKNLNIPPENPETSD